MVSTEIISHICLVIYLTNVDYTRTSIYSKLLIARQLIKLDFYQISDMKQFMTRVPMENQLNHKNRHFIKTVFVWSYLWYRKKNLSTTICTKAQQLIKKKKKKNQRRFNRPIWLFDYVIIRSSSSRSH